MSGVISAISGPLGEVLRDISPLNGTIPIRTKEPSLLASGKRVYAIAVTPLIWFIISVELMLPESSRAKHMSTGLGMAAALAFEAVRACNAMGTAGISSRTAITRGSQWNLVGM